MSLYTLGMSTQRRSTNRILVGITGYRVSRVLAQKPSTKWNTHLSHFVDVFVVRPLMDVPPSNIIT